MTRFPPELMDSIFSFLQPDENVDALRRFDKGIATLKRCSKDPILRRFAERHFYSNITVCNSVRVFPLEPHPGVFYNTVLAQLFSEQPHIAHYVCTLKIIVTRPDSLLEDILSKVSRLESITLSLYHKPAWDSLRASFRAAFVACIKSPRMKKVTLAHLKDFPLSLLDNCTIGNLTLKHVHFDSQLTFDSPSSHPVLDSLTLNNIRSDHREFGAWAKRHIHRLRSLTFSSLFIPEPFTLSVLLLCSNTLTTLHLDFLESCTSPLSMSCHLINACITGRSIYDVKEGKMTPSEECIQFSLSMLPHLQQLTIGMDMTLDHQTIIVYNYMRLKNFSALPTICHLLTTLPPSLTLLSLSLRIHCKSDCNAKVLSTVDWEPLVDVLNSLYIPQIFLDVLVVYYRFHTTPSIRDDEIIPALCRESVGLSKLIERGTLVIKSFLENGNIEWA